MNSHEEIDPLLLEEAAMAAWEHGRDSAKPEPLKNAIEWFRFLVEHPDGGEDARLRWLVHLADALTTLGEREEGTAKLEEAVEAYRRALNEKGGQARLRCRENRRLPGEAHPG
jgi:hypothetical protein